MLISNKNTNQKVLHIYKYYLLFILFGLGCCGAFAQNNYWQQQLDYTIHVSLNDKENTLDGDEKIIYTNHSPDTLRYLWFHLWPNAYKNDKTAFSEQLLRNGNTAFYFSNEKERGYINQLRFTVNEINATLLQDSNNIDIAKLILPQPLPPSGSITIVTPFHVKLPYNFSRSGYEGETYQVAQWYPKPAVYDAKGWHQMPYLDQGEFYGEFANWDVTISLPKNYIVAASGDLQNEDELSFLKTTGKQPAEEQANYKLWNNGLREEAARLKKRFNEVMPPSSTSSKTLRYKLSNAHDFAWFASKLFLVQYDTVKLATHTTDAFTFYIPWSKTAWQNSLRYLKSSVHFYSGELGEYPYNEVSAVLGDAAKEAGGMEYPTITLLEMNDSGKELDATLAHEVGHNWLYGILATNERDDAWMDEGINTFYEQRYIAQRYEPKVNPKFPFSKLPDDYDTLLLSTLMKLHKDQPITTTSDSFTAVNYNEIVYSKTAMWLQRIEVQLGTSLFDSCMHNYYRTWSFKHPQPEDFQRSVEGTSGKSLANNFAQLHAMGSFFPQQHRQLKPTLFFNEREPSKYNYLSLAPAIGYNYYDKLMIGGLIHNYQFPLNRFNFLLAPLYATGSHTLNGAARAGFSTFTKRSWLEISVSALKYNINSFTQYDNSKLYFSLNRIVPSVKYRLYNKDLRNTQRWTFTAKSFLISEEGFGDFVPVVVSPDTFYAAQKGTTHRYVNELSAVVSNNRKLYPYEAELKINQGKTFLRAGFTGNYYFNYAKQNGGIQARFFAGKFFYLQQKTILSKGENDRYLFTLSGPKGYEDFTYSDYFLGRSEFDGGLSQQIMQRDGFLKLSTPLLNEPVGKTDDWLLSINLSGDIPDQINPLKLLPFPVPVQLFVDIGTYSDAWKDENSNGRFLYDAGIKVSILKSAFSVYLPIVYSKVYRDYYKSFYPEKRFSHTVSFAFDLSRFQPNKINRNLPL